MADSAVQQSVGGILVAAVKQLRPKQWTKNAFVFPALLFSGRFLDIAHVGWALLAFITFSLLASAGYILNDYLDREADRRHPKKKFRPIASGALSVPAAMALLVATFTGGAAIGWYVSPMFLAVALCYLATTLLYSFVFKHRVILDVMFLASGFVWRVVGGAVAIGVSVSDWLFLCTAFLALFLGFNKRRGELLKLGAGQGTRKNLEHYSPQMLEQFQGVVTGGVITCYSLYCVLGPTRWMILTLPFVLYGIFRYIYLVDRHGEGDAPDETLLRDWPTLLTVLLYGLLCVAISAGHHLDALPKLR